jgi:RNA polymerase sigma-70 factor (ECF subfamily)
MLGHRTPEFGPGFFRHPPEPAAKAAAPGQFLTAVSSRFPLHFPSAHVTMGLEFPQGTSMSFSALYPRGSGTIDATSLSLLERLCQPAGQEAAAWDRFVHLYTPLLYHWVRRLRLPPEDAADLVQEVLTTLVQKLPEFHYDPRQSFRAWLRTITLNKGRDLCRRRAARPAGPGDRPLPDVGGPDSAAAFDESEYRQHLVRRALQLMQAEFQPVTWKACWEYMIAERPAADVARELGVTVNAGYLAKSRVLTRLRQELAGLVD